MSEANVDKKVKGARKVRTGYVVSDKMQKTIVVELEDRKPHPLYKKTMRTNSKVKVHDENETAGVGDLVRIEETRPLSKDKHFRLVEIIELKDHPYFAATQAHPEFKSRPNRPHPLFNGFMEAAVKQSGE